MVQAFRAARVVGHPTQHVWGHLTDWDRAAGWLGVDSIRAEGPTAVGTRLRFVTRGKERTSEITALDPGRSITLRSVQGGVTADYTYTVEPAHPGTEIALTADVRTRGAWALAGPALRAAIRRSDVRQVEALDRELDRS
jgi:carbon monoxide dehydrogenase subunit G